MINNSYKEATSKVKNMNHQQKSIGFASDIGLIRSTDEDSIVIMDLMTLLKARKEEK